MPRASHKVAGRGRLRGGHPLAWSPRGPLVIDVRLHIGQHILLMGWRQRTDCARGTTEQEPSQIFTVVLGPWRCGSC